MNKIRKIILITVIMISALFFCQKEDVYADIDWKGVTIECIYADGGLYEYSYNDYNDSWAVNRYSYALKGVDNSESQTSSSIIYSTADNHKSPARGTIPHCTEYITKSVVSEDDSEESAASTSTYIKFFNGGENAQFDDNDFGITWWDKFWFNKGADKDKANANAKTYQLVSENYVLTEAAGEADKVYNYKRENKKEEGEIAQVVSNPEQLTIYEFGDIKLIQSKEKTNYLGDFSYPEVACFSNSDPKSFNGNNSNVTYYFESKKTDYKEGGDTCTAGYYRFVYNGEGAADDGDVDTGALCTKIMPETSKNLAEIIGWVQILIPVLLIILTAFDIGKIVLSGNLDEELPKQKKKIITRFIVAVSFFFLPLIVNLLLTYVKIDSNSSEEEVGSIEYIKCIFEMV